MNEPHEGNSFVRHIACPSCGSSDGNALHTDGHTYCHVCKTWKRGDGKDADHMGYEPTPSSFDEDAIHITGEVRDLASRGIRKDTCQFWSYRVGEFKGRAAQFAYYLDPDTRKPISAKVRFPDKSFTTIGNHKSAPLYGQWLWRDGGKMVVVVEGEIDALSVSQVQNNKWAVVSVQNGAQGAGKSIRKAVDWLMKFDTVVFMFDMDEPGRAASIECAKLLPPGKAKIAVLPLKDPNEMLQANRGAELIDAIWGAREYRPDGIVAASEMWEQVSALEERQGVPYPFQSLNEKTSGIRKRELVTVTAGSGIGKSLFCREIAFDLMVNNGWKVGYVALEENCKRTILGLAGIALDVPLHIHRDGVSDTDFRTAFETVTPNLYLYDSFGSVEPDNLLERLRYLAVGMQCDALILDHISIAISGLDGDDERKTIDRMMTKLRSLVEETGVAMIIVSHLRRPMGDKGHEQGAVTSLSALRGSHSIAQLSDMVIGLERNQQGDNPNETVMRVLKNRYTGETGECGSLYYNKETGRLTEQPFSEVTNDNPF